jgi:predicted NUDIX family NTP pyrophosphohydrolase
MSRVRAQSARRVQLQTQRHLSEVLWTAHERRSAALQSFPEGDRLEFFALPEARRKINPAQVELVDRLEKELVG